MRSLREMERALSRKDRKKWHSLTTPYKIQQFLDALPYRAIYDPLCPLSVLRQREAHCFDGAVFGAAALHRIGHEPRIVYLTAQRDDDHLLALYKVGKFWGAVSKSNYTGLRFRDPVYRSLRELILSYFEAYFNVRGEKTLRGYTAPLSLKRFDRMHWMTVDGVMENISDALDTIRSFRFVTPQMARKLSPVDRRSLRAGLLGANVAGLYKP